MKILEVYVYVEDKRWSVANTRVFATEDALLAHFKEYEFPNAKHLRLSDGWGNRYTLLNWNTPQLGYHSEIFITELII